MVFTDQNLHSDHLSVQKRIPSEIDQWVYDIGLQLGKHAV